MNKLRRAALAAAIASTLAACGGGDKAAGPADATPPEATLVVHVVKPDGSHGGEYKAGSTTGPVEIDAVDRLEIMAQAKDPDSGPRAMSVMAEVALTCTLPDQSTQPQPPASREVGHSERKELVPMVMAAASGYADELFGLRCAAPAVTGTATVKLVATATNREGTTGTAPAIEFAVKGIAAGDAKAKPAA